MKYFAISDVHGAYDKMISALNAAGFNKETDTLINIGDSFDRGDKDIEVLKFLLDCPHHILIWGNHDHRLYELLSNLDSLQSYDISNGTFDSICQFAGVNADDSIESPLTILQRANNEITELLNFYFSQLNYAVEIGDRIFTHGWLPTTYNKTSTRKIIMGDWRTRATKEDWNNAIWAHTENMMYYGALPPKKKTLIVGHWHAWRIANYFGDERVHVSTGGDVTVDTSLYMHKNCVFIDGMSTYENGGSVNVYTFESDSDPKFYNPSDEYIIAF